MRAAPPCTTSPRGRWDEALCEMFTVPMSVLPEVRTGAGRFGVTDEDVLGQSLPICGVAGDQQAALVGQACFAAGDVKSTYGTGAFLVLNTAGRFVPSKNRLLSTIAYQLNGAVTYALEGSILSAGAAVQWLRDGLGLISKASGSRGPGGFGAAQRRRVPRAGIHRTGEPRTGIRMRAPPSWDSPAHRRAPRSRGATLDSIAFQTYDLLDAMAADGLRPETLRSTAAWRRTNCSCSVWRMSLGGGGTAADESRIHGIGRRLPGRSGLRPVPLPRGHRRAQPVGNSFSSRRCARPSGTVRLPAGAMRCGGLRSG